MSRSSFGHWGRPGYRRPYVTFAPATSRDVSAISVLQSAVQAAVLGAPARDSDVKNHSRCSSSVRWGEGARAWAPLSEPNLPGWTVLCRPTVDGRREWVLEINLITDEAQALVNAFWGPVYRTYAHGQRHGFYSPRPAEVCFRLAALAAATMREVVGIGVIVWRDVQWVPGPWADSAGGEGAIAWIHPVAFDEVVS